MFREYHRKHNYPREMVKLGALHCWWCVRGETMCANYAAEERPPSRVPTGEADVGFNSAAAWGQKAASCRSSGNSPGDQEQASGNIQRENLQFYRRLHEDREINNTYVFKQKSWSKLFKNSSLTWSCVGLSLITHLVSKAHHGKTSQIPPLESWEGTK